MYGSAFLFSPEEPGKCLKLVTFVSQNVVNVPDTDPQRRHRMSHFKTPLKNMDDSSKNQLLTVENIIREAWELTKLHFPIFLIFTLVMAAVSSAPRFCLTATAPHHQLQEVILSGCDDPFAGMCCPATWQFSIQTGLSVLIAGLLTVYLQAAFNHMLVETAAGQNPQPGKSLRQALRTFLHFLVVYIVLQFVLVGATLCCLLPGIYLMVRWLFVPLIAMDKPELSLGETFARSWDMTRGHFGQLLWLGIASIVINILGFLCCCIGLCFTAVLTTFMLGATYQLLKPEDEPLTAPATEE